MSKSEINSFDSLLLCNNSANIGVVYLLGSTAQFYGETEFSHNFGSYLLFNSNATFRGTVNFINCSEPMQSQDRFDMQEGGALTVLKSNIIFTGTSTLMKNYAKNGGAIHASESKLYINGEMTIANNTANDTGGGVYLDMSEVHCQSNSYLELLNNVATKKGGGVHAISSVVNVNGNFTYNTTTAEATYSGSSLYFTDNKAEKGGGLCLEINAKLYILKFMPHNESSSIVTFTGNSANLGGAVYVSDDSNLGQCNPCLLYTSPSPRDATLSRMPSSA